MPSRIGKNASSLRAVSTLCVLIGMVFIVSTTDSCNPAKNRATTQPVLVSSNGPHNENPRTAPWLYPSSTTRQVLNDLRDGEGKPPPANTPWEYFNMSGHGWIEEGTDLSRVAMQELSRRDKEGLLSPADQREIDQLALADLDNPIKTPGQFYIRQYLGDRWLSGKLPNDELDQLYQTAIHPSLATDPVVTQWDDVPLRLRCKCVLPSSSSDHWDLIAHFKSIRLDGTSIGRSDKLYRNSSDPDYAFRLEGFDGGRDLLRVAIPCSNLGIHQIEVKLQIDIRRGYYRYPEHRPVQYSKVFTLYGEFIEQPPSFALKVARFFQDPSREALHYISAGQLQLMIDHPVGSLSTLAMFEFMRRRHLAEVTPAEEQQLIADLLAVQKDRSRHWFPEFGDYLEWLHDQHALSPSQWKQYGAQQLGFYIRSRGSTVIKQGDPLPFEFVELARRGNSKARRYTGSQWKMSIDFSDGVTGPFSMEDMNLGIDHEGNEYPVQNQAKFASATVGMHTMRANITDYDLTWTDRPADLVIPTDYDLGEITFTVVPKTADKPN